MALVERLAVDMKRISPQRMAVALLVLAASGARAAHVLWPTPGPAHFRQRARDDFETRRQARAEANLSRPARTGLLTSDGWMLRGLVAAAGTHDDTALDYLEYAPDNDPIAPAARPKAGQIELRRDRVGSVESHFLKVLALDPGLIQAHRELIYTYVIQLHCSEIDARFRTLSRLIPLTYQDAFLRGPIRTTD